MKCQYIKSNKVKCQAFSQKDKDYCFRHDPENEVVSKLSSQKGGQNRALQGFYGKAVRLNNPEDIKKFLGQVINGVWSEGIPVPVGSSMGFLTRCWLDAYEASDVVKRLDEIEEKITKSLS